MLFNSIEYIFVFLPLVFILYFLLNKFKLYKTSTIFLLIASLIFYRFYKIEYVYILTVSVIVNYLLSLCFDLNLNQKKRKILLACSIILNVIILLGFKYFVMVANIYTQINKIPFNPMEYIIPLGISFFTIQEISYLIDCYKGEIKEKNFFDYALFVSFFPQLVAGPIVRYNEMIPQFKDISKKSVNQQNIFTGIFLITVGLLKKVILADNFSDFIEIVMKFDIYKDFYCSWFLGLSKVLQGYFDFSGYCDMALGSAYIFNISLPWNFNSPYKAQSIIEHWSRWNMTMMRFLKDYIYAPIVNNSNNLLKICMGFIIVFFIYGIWQGSSAVNVVYGLLIGVFVCINFLWNRLNIKIPKIPSIFITFLTLIILTPFLGVKSLNESFLILKTMFGSTDNFYHLVINGIYLKFVPCEFDLKINILILILSFYLIFISKNSTQLAKIYAEKNNIFYTILLAVILFISTLYITKSTPFIYFAF